MMNSNSRRFSSLVLVLVVGGCANAGRGGSRPDRDRLTAEEIAGTEARDAYEAVESLRPTWLAGRGSTSVRDPTPEFADVFLDGVSTGSGPEYLRSVHVSGIVEIRFYSAAQAAARYGMGHPRGVIDVITVRDRARTATRHRAGRLSDVQPVAA